MPVRIPLGDSFYIYACHEGSVARKAILSSDGSFLTDQNSFFHVNKEYIKPPQGVTLVMYSAHGCSLEDPGINSLYGDTIPVYERISYPQSVVNYRLSKYKDDNKQNIFTSLSQPWAEGFDVITVRERSLLNLSLFPPHFKVGATLSELFRALEAAQRHYDEIRCAFCRSPWYDVFRDT